MTIEEIKDKAIRLIEGAASGLDIQKEARELIEDYISLDAKYKKGDIVWVFDFDYKFICAKVSGVISKSIDGTFWYQLHEDTGRYVGKWNEGRMFPTKQALKNHIINICKNDDAY